MCFLVSASKCFRAAALIRSLGERTAAPTVCKEKNWMKWKWKVVSVLWVRGDWEWAELVCKHRLSHNSGRLTHWLRRLRHLFGSGSVWVRKKDLTSSSLVVYTMHWIGDEETVLNSFIFAHMISSNKTRVNKVSHDFISLFEWIKLHCINLTFALCNCQTPSGIVRGELSRKLMSWREDKKKEK